MTHDELLEALERDLAWRGRAGLSSEALAHLDDCPSCRALVAGLEVEAQAEALEPPDGYWSSFDEKLERRLAALRAPAPVRSRRTARRAGVLIAAAAAVVAAGIVLVGRRPPDSRGQDASAAAALIRAASPGDVEAAIAALGVDEAQDSEADPAAAPPSTLADDVLGIADPLASMEAELADLDEHEQRELARVLLEASS